VFKNEIVKPTTNKEQQDTYRWENDHWVVNDRIIKSTKNNFEIDSNNEITEPITNKEQQDTYRWENDHWVVNDRIIKPTKNNFKIDSNNEITEPIINEEYVTITSPPKLAGCLILLLPILLIVGIIGYYMANSPSTVPPEAKEEAWGMIGIGLVFTIICIIIFFASFAIKGKETQKGNCGCMTLGCFIFLISIFNLINCIREGGKLMNITEQEWQQVIQERQKEKEAKETHKWLEERERREERERIRRYREEEKLKKELKKRPIIIIIMEK
jgi:hypothetical protein